MELIIIVKYNFFVYSTERRIIFCYVTAHTSKFGKYFILDLECRSMEWLTLIA